MAKGHNRNHGTSLGHLLLIRGELEPHPSTGTPDRSASGRGVRVKARSPLSASGIQREPGALEIFLGHHMQRIP